MGDQPNTLGDKPREARLATFFATPASVLIILPALVIFVGVVVLMLGRRATKESAETMARHQLVAQAIEVQNDLAFALGQADPVFGSLRLLAEPALPTPDAVQRMRDVVTGRPGIVNTSVVFPGGVMWGTFFDRTTGELQVHETRIGETRTTYAVRKGKVDLLATVKSDYEPRTRPQYTMAVDAKGRVWMPPRTFESSKKTGLTVTEPVYGTDGSLTAVLTIDFDVAELSKFIGKAPLAGARTVMFTADGTVLAYPSAPIPDIARKEQRLLRYQDFGDPALDALFTAIGTSTATQQRFMRIEATDGSYLASVAAVGGKRAGTTTALAWYLATLVPERTLFGATRKLGRDSIIASSAALAIALGVALMFAWNLIRMRRAVGAARAAAKTAEEHAKQLGSYRLVEKLGTGGMGEVWRAEHQLLARAAAIKLIRPEALVDPKHSGLILERFRREAQTLASLRSRHTIELYDYGTTDDGAFFFVMELLDGLDLAELVKHHGPQPAARVINIIAQACQSLAEAHDAGLLHRDIKPANLYLCRAADEVDILKLLDFGIVHSAKDPIDDAVTGASLAPGPALSTGERLTAIGVVIGTPGYIPPEQAVGARLDARGDLYALGCVAWYLLSGRDVYGGIDGDEVLHRHVTQPIPTLGDKVRGWLPPELEALIVSCLAKDPKDRPADARALANALYEIAIPPEHAWSRAQATAWWASLKPTATSSPEVPTAVGAVVVAKVSADVSTSLSNAVIGAPPSTELPTSAEGARLIVPQRDTPVGPPDIPTVMSRPSSGRIE